MKRTPRSRHRSIGLLELVVLVVIMALALQWGFAWVRSVFFPPLPAPPWDKVAGRESGAGDATRKWFPGGIRGTA